MKWQPALLLIALIAIIALVMRKNPDTSTMVEGDNYSFASPPGYIDPLGTFNYNFPEWPNAPGIPAIWQPSAAQLADMPGIPECGGMNDCRQTSSGCGCGCSGDGKTMSLQIYAKKIKNTNISIPYMSH